MKKRYKIVLSILGFIVTGLILPERKHIPVLGADQNDWNANTFWYEPWGSSGVHKGIDIFAESGTAVIASSDLLVIYRGNIAKGGNVIVGLGAKWRLHYFAHLQEIDPDAGIFIGAAETLGTVGDSGNAQGKAPHLHFSIVSLIPLPWLIDTSTQGYKKAFYLNPITYFSE